MAAKLSREEKQPGKVKDGIVSLESQECQATTISTFLSLLGLNAMMTEGMWNRSERMKVLKKTTN